MLLKQGGLCAGPSDLTAADFRKCSLVATLHGHSLIGDMLACCIIITRSATRSLGPEGLHVAYAYLFWGSPLAPPLLQLLAIAMCGH